MGASSESRPSQITAAWPSARPRRSAAPIAGVGTDTPRRGPAPIASATCAESASTSRSAAVSASQDAGRHAEISAIASLDDEIAPSHRLLDIAEQVLPVARRVSMKAVSERIARLTQIIADITTDEGFAEHQDLRRDADLIFADAAKDGHQERVFLRRFEQVGFSRAPLVVFDDIRVYNMLQIWRDISRPKLDLTF